MFLQFFTFLDWDGVHPVVNKPIHSGQKAGEAFRERQDVCAEAAKNEPRVKQLLDLIRHLRELLSRKKCRLTDLEGIPAPVSIQLPRFIHVLLFRLPNQQVLLPNWTRSLKAVRGLQNLIGPYSFNSFKVCLRQEKMYQKSCKLLLFLEIVRK